MSRQKPIPLLEWRQGACRKPRVMATNPMICVYTQVFSLNCPLPVSWSGARLVAVFWIVVICGTLPAQAKSLMPGELAAQKNKTTQSTDLASSDHDQLQFHLYVRQLTPSEQSNAPPEQVVELPVALVTSKAPITPAENSTVAVVEVRNTAVSAPTDKQSNTDDFVEVEALVEQLPETKIDTELSPQSENSSQPGFFEDREKEVNPDSSLPTDELKTNGEEGSEVGVNTIAALTPTEDNSQLNAQQPRQERQNSSLPTDELKTSGEEGSEVGVNTIAALTPTEDNSQLNAQQPRQERQKICTTDQTCRDEVTTASSPVSTLAQLPTLPSTPLPVPPKQIPLGSGSSNTTSRQLPDFPANEIPASTPVSFSRTSSNNYSSTAGQSTYLPPAQNLAQVPPTILPVGGNGYNPGLGQPYYQQPTIIMMPMPAMGLPVGSNGYNPGLGQPYYQQPTIIMMPMPAMGLPVGG
ncbi:MAG: hypothetical protein WA919_09545, partial [Coleofasciculaceae cyanobacterium]